MPPVGGKKLTKKLGVRKGPKPDIHEPFVVMEFDDEDPTGDPTGDLALSREHLLHQQIALEHQQFERLKKDFTYVTHGGARTPDC